MHFTINKIIEKKKITSLHKPNPPTHDRALRNQYEQLPNTTHSNLIWLLYISCRNGITD